MTRFSRLTEGCAVGMRPTEVQLFPTQANANPNGTHRFQHPVYAMLMVEWSGPRRERLARGGAPSEERGDGGSGNVGTARRSAGAAFAGGGEYAVNGSENAFGENSEEVTCRI